MSYTHRYITCIAFLFCIYNIYGVSRKWTYKYHQKRKHTKIKGFIKANLEFFAKIVSKNKNKPHWHLVKNGLKSKD